MDSKKINIAIFISSELETGGRFQYEYKILDILKKYHKDQNINLKFYGLREKVKKDYIDLNLDINIIKENIFQKLHRYSLSLFLFYYIFSKIMFPFSVKNGYPLSSERSCISPPNFLIDFVTEFLASG